MYQFKCAVCGREFSAAHFNVKYCSDECREIVSKQRFKKYMEIKSDQIRAEVKYCQICGSPINKDTGRRKYCSDECVKAAKGMAVDRPYARRECSNPDPENQSKLYEKRLKKTLTDIRKKSTLDKDLQTLQKDGEKHGLKSYDYGKYARIKGL